MTVEPIRGILYGLLLSVPFWLLLIVLLVVVV